MMSLFGIFFILAMREIDKKYFSYDDTHKPGPAKIGLFTIVFILLFVLLCGEFYVYYLVLADTLFAN